MATYHGNGRRSPVYRVPGLPAKIDADQSAMDLVGDLWLQPAAGRRTHDIPLVPGDQAAQQARASDLAGSGSAPDGAGAEACQPADIAVVSRPRIAAGRGPQDESPPAFQGADQPADTGAAAPGDRAVALAERIEVFSPRPSSPPRLWPVMSITVPWLLASISEPRRSLPSNPPMALEPLALTLPEAETFVSEAASL